MNKLTPRGWLVLVILPAIALIALTFWVSGQVWYVPTDTGGHYCIGSMTECYAKAFTR
jgi:hypothetical protein